MARFVDYYALFGVDRAASEEKISAAYRKCIRDLEGASMSQAEKIETIRLYEEAFFVLSDKTRRWEYNYKGEFLKLKSSSFSTSQTDTPQAQTSGVPVILVWGLLIVIGIALYQGNNTFSKCLFWDTMMWGSIFIINSIIVGKNMEGAWNVRYPIKKELYQDKFRISFFRGLTIWASCMIFLSFSSLVFHWFLFGMDAATRPYEKLIGARIILGIFCAVLNIASIYSAYTGDDFINSNFAP